MALYSWSLCCDQQHWTHHENFVNGMRGAHHEIAAESHSALISATDMDINVSVAAHACTTGEQHQIWFIVYA